jgi:DNA-3-methyladenine glycosylase II
MAKTVTSKATSKATSKVAGRRTSKSAGAARAGKPVSAKRAAPATSARQAAAPRKVQAPLKPVASTAASTLASTPSSPAFEPSRATQIPSEVLPPVIGACPLYWEEALADLIKRDRILRRLIPRHPDVFLASRGEPFITLARSITGQQISVKAADAVWGRVRTAAPRLTPAAFLRAGSDKLAAAGLSKRKCEYILDLAEKFNSRQVHPERWAGMDDEEVIADLIQIRGIGRWTAEMFLMFNLVRPNVLPLDDVGLIKAISVHYFSGEPVSRSEAREVADNWAPWRTVATWYLWRSLDPVPVEY